ncbi:SAM-dependent methyltransferase [Catalinimonas alkaloidigena]|uniref:class I SAM-dependent DNA methyltransferase n=1 Tax=Catalinimonas alkaloidigena TaxID=1075417 RepID=UPI002406A3E9|nr:SAM-dependent methyltransferase [Catalinimonas alkaloidigena]MDF9797079.1 SAM-dependent methyltransferase [Catalinimonas alkaloidigena]
MPKQSLPPQYFDNMYEQDPDPWQFASSDYERKKYLETIHALPKSRYDYGLEVGCSIGVLTEMLAPYCKQLLSIDASELPLRQARERLKDQPHVCIAPMRIPEVLPEQAFDLILISEVGYYWSHEDLAAVQAYISKALLPGGHLLLVHWTPYVEDYPLTGDEVHEAFSVFAQTSQQLTHLRHQRHEQYRLDLWEANF